MLNRGPSASPLPTTTIARLIDQCSNTTTTTNATRQLQQIHSQILTSPSLPPSAASSLLSRLLFPLSLSPSSLSYSSALFHRIPSPSLSAYNAIIRAHALPSSPLNPLSFYSHLLARGLRPDYLTFPFLIKHCSLHLDPQTGRSLHAHVVKLGFTSDVFIQNALIFMYASCSLIDLARRVFDEMPSRDVVSQNSILVGYLRSGDVDSALGLFLGMKERSIRSWNAIIAGLVQAGRAREALDFFNEMLVLSCVKPDKVTVASVISACASLGALDQGRWVHGYLKRHGLEFDVVIGTALVDMYGKCGCVERAVEVFSEMPERDVLAWTAMISALAIHGLGREAFALLEEMEKYGVKPNHVTFGALLSASAHSGMVEKGRWCFDAMRRVYSIEPRLQHYACMVDLLGRVGMFDEAERLIESMPMEPDSFVWGALLGACRMHGNVEVGERVAGYLIGLEPLNHAYYIVLSDIYAKANRFDDVKRVRGFMKEQGIKKISRGCSMIEVEGQVVEFAAKGTPGDLMKEIEWVLSGIHCELKLTGCSPNENEGLLEVG